MTKFGIRLRNLPSSFFGVAAVHASLHPPQHAVVGMLQRHVEIRHDPLRRGDRVDQLVGYVHRIEVHQANPVEPVDLLQLAEQFDEPRLAVQVHAVVRRVLGHDHQLAHAVGGQLTGLGDHFFDRLGGVLAAHLRDRAERAQPVAAFGDLQEREMLRRDSQPGRVGQRVGRRRVEDRCAVRLVRPAAGRPLWSLPRGRTRRPAGRSPAARSSSASCCRSARQPDTITPRSSPRRLSSSISSMAANDSCRACSMKPHVLTTAKSAPLGSLTSS